MKNSPIQRTCDIYRRAVAAGDDLSAIIGELAHEDGVQRPAIWRRLRSGGVLPPYERRGARTHSLSYEENNRRHRASAEARAARALAMDAKPRVDRDPCPRCGVRRDVGCEHSTVMLGTSF